MEGPTREFDHLKLVLNDCSLVRRGCGQKGLVGAQGDLGGLFLVVAHSDSR